MTVLFSLILLGLIAGIFISIEAGYHLGLRRGARVPKTDQIGSQAMEASVFGLMGLLIAFTFYGAGSRFDVRRSLVAQEANAVGTAYLRLDLLPPEAQSLLREDFRRYVRSRLAVYQALPDSKAVSAALDRSSALQGRVWKDAIEAVKGSGPAEKLLVLSSLNEMIDITTVRTVALETHPPGAIFVMLALTVMASSGLAGYTMAASGRHDWIFLIVYTLVLGTSVHVILDYEFPRIGIVRIDSLDQLLVQALDKMK